MIEVKDLCAGYGQSTVLQQVSLRFEAGTVTVLAGPNGSGKSTLLKCAAGLLSPQSGTVTVAGRPLQAYDRRALAQTLAYLPQSRPVPSISVSRMVLHGRFPYLGYPRRYRQADRDAARSAMERCGILYRADRPVSALSGGERQKVYLAMAVAQNTPAVLLDEPTTYLDIRHQLEVLELAKSLTAAGKTVVLVLHDLNLALQYADRIALLENGRLAAEGTPDEIAQSGVLERVFGVRADPLAGPGGRVTYAFRLPESAEN